MQKAVEFSRMYMDDIGLPFSSRSFNLSAAYVQLEFGESAASDQVRLLYTTFLYSFAAEGFMSRRCTNGGKPLEVTAVGHGSSEDKRQQNQGRFHVVFLSQQNQGQFHVVFLSQQNQGRFHVVFLSNKQSFFFFF